ncbi:MAG: HPF/RaiA family ribosome-associated protein [Deltaproteobacteria bacterium]|nr:HPF/RaiA family ribosome-associated protein [Deltaproteobacteria bacterium]
MRYEISKHHCDVDATLAKAIEHKVEKVAERLKRYHPDVADMDIRLEFHDKQKMHECTLHLRAMKDTLHAKKDAPELRVAVDKSFDALMKELEHYRVKINKSLSS